MSVESLAVVLNHSRAKGTARLVMIGIANHDGDGGSWPSKATLARYAALGGKPRSASRRVQRILRELEDLGEIACYPQGGGLAGMSEWTRPNLYRITLDCPAGCRAGRHVDN